MTISEVTAHQLDEIFDKVYIPEAGKGLTFPETVTQLYELGVTRYRVDFVTSTTTAYIGGYAHQYRFPSYTPLRATTITSALPAGTAGPATQPIPEENEAPSAVTPTEEKENPDTAPPTPRPMASRPHPPPLALTTLMPGMMPWSLDKLRTAIKKAREDAKNLKPDLPTYTRQIIEAGVVDYTCFIEGRKVMYTGCNGDAYSAWFMGAGPDAPLNKGYTPMYKTPVMRRNTALG